MPQDDAAPLEYSPSHRRFGADALSAGEVAIATEAQQVAWTPMSFRQGQHNNERDDRDGHDRDR